MEDSMTVLFFKTPLHFRKWLQKNHQKNKEQWVGFYKKSSGKSSITWPESVDQALCFGWIDGLRRSINDESYKIRFTPRNPKSHWSKINIARYKDLEKQGIVTESGRKAYQRIDKNNSKRASYEQRTVRLTPTLESEFKKNKKAWKFFQSMPPYYRRNATWWIMSARQETTKLRRLIILIEDSEKGEKIKPLRR